jgi:signal transduction histidine kinase
MDRLLRVLMVEDSEEDAELVGLALRRGGYEIEGHRVDTRETMAEALERDWDVIVADFSMPRFSLSEALRMVKDKGLDTPFLIVSASIIEEDAIHAMREGACDFIMKDRLARIAPAVERELRECAMRRDRRRLEEHVRQNQKMESLGVLAGGVAHDFNNLLVGIMGNASLAMDMLPDGSPLSPLLEDVVLASQKAADLTRQMLAYAGKGRFISEPTDIGALAKDIAGLVRTSISKKVSLNLELDKTLPRVEADPTQIQQLIMNLLLNGAEAVGEGPGTVTLRTGVRETRPSAETGHFVHEPADAGQYVCLQVCDDGCGMNEETKSRIFEPFFTTKFTGRGLGLAAALGIVRGHRGALKVESSPGGGSTFEILFPAISGVASAKPATRREMISRKSIPAPGPILIVDDEDVVRRTAKTALEKNGYTVLLSENGLHAVDVFSGLSDQISLVLLDLTMPVMGGEEAYYKLREIRPDLDIILTSGYEEAQALANLQGKEIAGFLKKPYAGEDLAAMGRGILGARAATV